MDPVTAMAAPAPLRPPSDLTIPGEGSTTAREVLTRAIRRLLTELYGLSRTAPRALDEAAEVAAFAATIERLRSHGGGALVSLARRPTIATLVRCLRRTAGADPAVGAGHFRELRALVYFELALVGDLPGTATVARAPTRLVSQAAGLAVDLPRGSLTVAPNRVTVTSAAGGTRTYDLAALVRGAEAEGVSRPFHPITEGIALALVDNNPLALVEAHPDKSGNAVDLGGHGPAAWVDVLRSAFGIVATHLPALRAEMQLFLHQIVPVGYDPERHLSASYQEAIGAIYMTLHPSLMTMTEALIHEFSHTKLNALFELDPVLDNAFWPLYASPVRPDPRPLHGVLLAVHAFQPVARLYEAMTAAGDPRAARPDFQNRFAQIRRLNREGAATVLTHGRPTPVGRALLDEIRRWDEHFADPGNGL